MTPLPGVTGTLFPGRFLADRLAGGGAPPCSTRPPSPAAPARQATESTRGQLDAWWRRVAATCGPATGARAIFDLVAAPLFGMLGYRAHDLSFDRARTRARLVTPAGDSVALVILPWADRPSGLWREATTIARDMNADWCFLLAPPYLSLVDTRGRALRRHVDFTLPSALDPASFRCFHLLSHASAFDRSGGGTAAGLRAPRRIDLLVAEAARFQDRVREDLQRGVVDALRALDPAVGRPGPSHAQPRFDEALTLVYRVLFLLFAESRHLVPRDHPIYGPAYAVDALRREALRDSSARGLWDGLAAVSRLSRRGCRTDDLIVRPFNGHLFARAAAPSLETPNRTGRDTVSARTRDVAMQRTLVALGSRRGAAGREEISYADLGVEQLGAVYERVLDLDPGATQPPITTPPPERTARSAIRQRHSVRRKETGTFYTPQSLADFVVRRTLAPLVHGATTAAILDLRIVDPAMGSGAFLVAACRYLAGAYERAMIDEGAASPSDIDDDERAGIRRMIAERCLAGVDANPVAVQLARLSLWLTSLARDKPLGFLDHRLRVGNSLIGASPDDLRRTAAPGRPAVEASLPLLDPDLDAISLGRIVRPLGEIAARHDETVDDVRAKETMWRALTAERSALGRWRLAATMWCARWFWPADARTAGVKPPSPAELRAVLDTILERGGTLRGPELEQWLAIAKSTGAAHQCFHWPIEFADVFYDTDGQPRTRPGFDAVIGNPPWEMLRRDRLSAPNAPAGHAAADRPASVARDSRSLVAFVRESGLYPSCNRGHLNLYQPFLERAIALCRTGGRVGLIVPWGLATDDGAAGLRQALAATTKIDTIVGLDNSAGLFPVHRGLRFMVAVTSPGAGTHTIRARFGVRTPAEIEQLPARDEEQVGANAYPVRLTTDQWRLVGGPSLRIPDARTASDLQLLVRLSRDHPRLGSPAGWNARFGRELNATEDRGSFGPRGLPVIEGKHLSPFVADARAAANRIDRAEAFRLLPDGRFEKPRLGYRDVSGVGNRVTLIAAMIPAGAVTTHTVFCLRTAIDLTQQHFLAAVLNSFVANSIVRLLMSGHLTTSLIEELPVPAWRATRLERRLARIAARLARRWSPRSAALLQAGVARLYDLDEHAFRELLRRFPLVPAADRDRAVAALRDL